MKGNDGSGNIIERDEWETPQELWARLNEQYHFLFDCCATPHNRKCRMHSENFLSLPIMKEISWMNPPYTKAKMMIRHFFKIIRKGVIIYRCDNMETKMWQKIIFPNASWVFIPDKRIVYEGLKGSGA